MASRALDHFQRFQFDLTSLEVTDFESELPIESTRHSGHFVESLATTESHPMRVCLQSLDFRVRVLHFAVSHSDAEFASMTLLLDVFGAPIVVFVDWFRRQELFIGVIVR